jgi:hypothetical protein
MSHFQASTSAPVNVSVYPDGLPIILYGAETFHDQITYCHEMDGAIHSHVSAIDYIPEDCEDGIKKVYHGLHFGYATGTPFLFVLELFILQWTAYLFQFAKYTPDRSVFQKFGVFYSPPAVPPAEFPKVFAINSWHELSEYIREVFDIQAEHEACVAMLRQVIAQSNELVPAKWLLWPGQAEPALTTQFGPTVPLNDRNLPYIPDFGEMYAHIRATQIDFYCYRPELYFRLDTSHSSNEEKLRLLISSNVAVKLNNHPDTGFFDVWERQPFFPPSPTESVPASPDSSSKSGWGPDAMEELEEKMDNWTLDEKKERAWSRLANHPLSDDSLSVYSPLSNDSLSSMPPLMEITPPGPLLGLEAHSYPPAPHPIYRPVFFRFIRSRLRRTTSTPTLLPESSTRRAPAINPGSRLRRSSFPSTRQRSPSLPRIRHAELFYYNRIPFGHLGTIQHHRDY